MIVKRYFENLMTFNFPDNVRLKLQHEDFSLEEWEAITDTLEDMYPDGVDIKTLNAIFALDFDRVREWAGRDVDDE